MLSSCVAVGYVAWRTMLFRLRRALRSPLRIAVAAAGVAAVGVMQFFALRASSGMAVGEVGQDAIVAAVLAAFAVLSFSATFQCPLWLRGADVAWLFPCPGGLRALVLRHVAGTAWVGVLAAAGVLVAGVAAGGLPPRTVQAPLAVAGLALGIRGMSTVVYLLRVQVVDRRVVRAVVPMALLAAALPAAARVFGFAEVVPAPVSGATEWLRRAVGALVTSVVTVGGADGGVLAITLAAAVLLCAAAVAAARGFTDDAARATWEAESVRAMLSDPAGSKAVVDLAGKQLTQGVPSFDRLTGLRGDAAFAWKALASARRSWRPQLRGQLPFVAAATVLALWAPSWAAIPVVLVLVIELLSGRFDGLPAELDRAFVHTVPGTSWRRVLAVDAAPAVRTMLGAVLVWLPVLVLSGLPAATRYGGLAAIPVAAVVVTLASSLSAVTVAGAGMRLLVAAGSVALALALTVGTAAVANVVAAAAVALVTAAAYLGATARLLPRRNG